MSNEFFEKVGTEVHGGGLATSGGQLVAYPNAYPSPPSAPMPLMGGAQMGSARRWAASDKTFWGVSSTFDVLPSGVYTCSVTPNGPILTKLSVSTDNLLELPDEASAAIIAEFQAFWGLGDAFRERGFLWKRGFLLWGPPGSGKTSCVQVLIKRLAAEMDGITLLLNHPAEAAVGLQMIRHIEPKRPLIAVMEDLDALVQKFGENEYLALLDGEAQVDNVVFLATTNYPERLDRRFVDRPSRFDTIRYIGMPSAAARRAFLQTKEPSLVGPELENWVTVSDGFSVAHMKELIIACRCFQQPLPDVVARLEEMRERRPNSERDPARQTFGFGRKNRQVNG